MLDQIVVFRLGRQRYGLDIRCVHEVVSWLEPTPIPMAPESVEGVLNLRGRVVPVLDLGRRFRMDRTGKGSDARIMVVEVRGQLVGLIVDEVSDVMMAPAESIEAPAPVLRGAGDQVVRGVMRRDDGALIVLLDETEVVGETASIAAGLSPAAAGTEGVRS